MGMIAGLSCPMRAVMRVIYIHLLLIYALFAGCEASTVPSSGGCPLSRIQLAFQAPINSLSAVLNGAAGSASTFKAGFFTPQSIATPRWMSEYGSPLRVQPRKTEVGRLGMSVVETSSGKKRSAELDEAAQKKAEKRARRIAAASKPLSVHVIGVSHHNSAVEVREKLAVPEAEWNDASRKLCEFDNIDEAVVLSTCNRFEVYVASHNSRAAIKDVVSFLQQKSGLPQSDLRRNLFMLSNDDAVWHLLRVSAGLDSLVVGEGQILSQVKSCYMHGTEEDGSAGKVVSRLFNTAVSAGKRARAETSISRGAVSISSAAVEFSHLRAEKDLGKPLLKSTIAIIGAGKMSRLLLVHMSSLGVKKVILVNRSLPKCKELQNEFPDIEMDIRLGGDDKPEVLETAIVEADVVFTSTSATACIVTVPQLERIGAGKRAAQGAEGKGSGPVMFVDISVPRNVESACSDVEGVFAYDVDDLKMVVARNTALRRREMLEAEDILMEERNKFNGWQQSLSAVPAISKMQEKFENMRSEEMRKVGNKLPNLSEKDLEIVDRLSMSIVSKMLHGPMSALRQPDGPEEKRITLKILKEMFKLEQATFGRNAGRGRPRKR